MLLSDHLSAMPAPGLAWRHVPAHKFALNGMHVCGTSSLVQSNQWTFFGQLPACIQTASTLTLCPHSGAADVVASMKTGGVCAKMSVRDMRA